MKTVILYYSRTRKTARVAKTLAEEIKADSIEIMDLKDRMGAINYITSLIDALRENKTGIKPDEFDLTEYDLVYIGTPTWGGKPAPAIITLIDKCDLKDKSVILFSTMGNSGGDKAIDRMNKKIEVRGGRTINSFSLKTSKMELNDISTETKRILEEVDLKK
jgi:flavodoxin